MKVGFIGVAAGYFVEFWRSLFFKVFAILCSFLLLPLMLRYLGGEVFGVWVAIFSVVSWVVFFDLGLGSGLRNKLSESLSRGDDAESATLVATAYVSIASLSALVFLIFLSINFFVNWQSVFNTQAISRAELEWSMLAMVFLFLANFTLMLVIQVLHASQKTSLTVAHQFFVNFIALVAIFLLSMFAAPSLMIVCVTYGVSQVVTTLFVSYLFYKSNQNVMPRWRYFNSARVKSIASLGGQFFIIQLAVLAIFSSDKIIIVKLFGPQSLTEYELIFKVFSSILIINTLFLSPLWSGYTRAAAVSDYAWMRGALIRSHMVALALLVPALILFFFGGEIIFLWSGYRISPDSGLLMGMLCLVVVRVWTDIYAYFLNGVGVLKIQMWIAIVQALVNIPLSVAMGYKFGLIGVVYGSIATLLVSVVLLPITVFMYMRRGRLLTSDV